jgi:hypothetical protein
MAQGWPNKILVDEHLTCLSGHRWKLAAFLNAATEFVKRSAIEERLRQGVCGGDGILNREVDAHASDWGHGMRGVADAE